MYLKNIITDIESDKDWEILTRSNDIFVAEHKSKMIRIHFKNSNYFIGARFVGLPDEKAILDKFSNAHAVSKNFVLKTKAILGIEKNINLIGAIQAIIEYNKAQFNSVKG